MPVMRFHAPYEAAFLPFEVTAYMLHPADEKLRNAYLARKMAEYTLHCANEDGLESVPVEILKDLLESPAPAGMDAMESIAIRGSVAGEILLNLIKLSASDEDASVNKAIHLGAQYFQEAQNSAEKRIAPSDRSIPLFIDDSASAYLHLLNQNQDRAPHIERLALAYAHTEVLQVPDRTVRAEVLRPLLKACRKGLRLECEYVSFSTPDGETRLIAPHTLVYTGMRWHVRAYCERNREYRDFVLSRFRGVPDVLDDVSEHDREGDGGWNTAVQVIIVPDSRLSAVQQAIIECDYGMQDGQLVIDTHGSLVQYVLQRYQIDPNKVHAKATAQQIVVSNLDDLKQWLYQ